MVAQHILKKTMIGIIGSIVSVIALLFILSKFINVNVDSMGGNTVYPPYPFIEPVLARGSKDIISVNQWMDFSTNIEVLGDYKGYGGSVVHWTDDYDKVINIEIEVEHSGEYHLAFDYLSDDNAVKPDELTIEINGITEDDYVNIRLWNVWTSLDENPTYDIYRNQVYTKNEPLSLWRTTLLRDQLALKKEPLIFNLIQGTNIIKLTKEQGEFFLGDIHIFEVIDNLDYESYLSSHPNQQEHDELILIEAENYTYKNSVSILPETDKSPNVSPFSFKYSLISRCDQPSSIFSNMILTASASFELMTYCLLLSTSNPSGGFPPVASPFLAFCITPANDLFAKCFE